MITTEGFALFDTYETVAKNAKDVSGYVAESIMNIYGVIVKVDLGKYEGLTSKQAVKEILLEYGLPEADIDARLDRYLEDLPYSYYNVAWSDKIQVTDGAKDLLEDMEKKEILVGIATGEEERVAHMRLGKLGIDQHFKFGAYGEAGLIFNDILENALKKSEELGVPRENGIYIASTPSLINIANRAKIRTVGVETDKHSKEELKNAGADITVKSLKDKGRIIDLVFR